MFRTLQRANICITQGNISTVHSVQNKVDLSPASFACLDFSLLYECGCNSVHPYLGGSPNPAHTGLVYTFQLTKNASTKAYLGRNLLGFTSQYYIIFSLLFLR